MALRRLLSLFQPNERSDAGNPFAEKLRHHLTSLSEDRLEFLAGFAGQLTRVAYADDDVSESERQSIAAILVEHANLPAADAAVVIDLLLGQLQRLRGTDEFQLNRAVNRHASAEEKEHLVDCLFAVAAADNLISNVEDQEIRRIAYGLDITNRCLMTIRSRYRDRLEILQSAAALRDG